jgi:hypothetical protein
MIEGDGKQIMMKVMMMMVTIMVGNFWSPLRVQLTVSRKTFWRAVMF